PWWGCLLVVGGSAGVCLFFENSTGCLISQCQSLFGSRLVCYCFGGGFLVGDSLAFYMPGLIL
ncbi:hypothetical protein, partial [Micromonospora sp. LOL_023]|uniref:hypothetical protein n=1 Tax=Micromonospora sp. LOL_023 TaxID=3345418 RepID=UPI003A85ECA8